MCVVQEAMLGKGYDEGRGEDIFLYFMLAGPNIITGVINITIQSLHKGKVYVGLEDMAEIIRVKDRFTF